MTLNLSMWAAIIIASTITGDNIIKRILLSLNGGAGAVCVLLASSFMSWLSLILFDIIYIKITD